MEGIDKKLEELKKQPQRRGLPTDVKKCPFQSALEDVPCSSDCALYRKQKGHAFACPILELPAISWGVKGSPPSRNWKGDYSPRNSSPEQNYPDYTGRG